MDFLNKLFPLKSLFTFDENFLTAIWVAVTILLFLILSWRMASKFRRIILSLREADKNPDIQKIKDDANLLEVCNRYFLTFIDYKDQGLKTEYEARLFFNEMEIINQNTSFRFWSSVPGILVGLGILGTFVGLSYGIMGFDTSDAPSIQRSIQVLLSGMGTAFISSVWGMGLSLIFIFIERYLFRSISNETKKLCTNLDLNYRLTKYDEWKIQKKDQEETFKSYFVFTRDGDNLVYPKDVFRRLEEESEQQTKALKSFSTDLADGIKITNETINALGSRLTTSFEESIQQNLGNSLANLNLAVEKLVESKEEKSEEVIREIIARLEESIKTIGADFQSSLSGAAMNQFNMILSTMQQLETNLSLLPNEISSMMEQFRQLVELQQTAMNKTATKAGEEAAAAIELMKEEIEGAAGNFNNIIKDLQSNMIFVLDKQEKSTGSVDLIIERTSKVLNESKNLNESMNKTLAVFESNFSKLSSLSNTILQSSDTLRNSSDALRQNTGQFQQYASQYLNANKENLRVLEKSLTEIKSLGLDYTNKFEVIRSGLTVIFEQIKRGLIDYQSATRESLNHYLSDFTGQLSSAASSLSGSIANLNEFTEVVSELVDKIDSIIKKSS